MCSDEDKHQTQPVLETAGSVWHAPAAVAHHTNCKDSVRCEHQRSIVYAIDLSGV